MDKNSIQSKHRKNEFPRPLFYLVLFMFMLFIPFSYSVSNDDILNGMTRFYCMDADGRECINGIHNMSSVTCTFSNIATVNGHSGAYQCANGQGGVFNNPIVISDQAFTVMALVKTAGGYDMVGWGINCGSADTALMADSGGALYLQARTGYVATGGTTLSAGFAYYFMTHDGDTLKGYINNSNLAASDAAGTTDAYTTDGCLAGRKQMGGGYVSQIGFWNRSLNTSEIDFIVANGITLAQEVSYNISLVLENASRKNISLNLIDEDDSFYINAIYKANNVPIGAGSVCNFSAKNISVFQPKINLSNYTFVNNAVNYSYVVSDSKTNAINDSYSLRLCHTTSQSADVRVWINDTILADIPKTVIPNCADGYHEQNNITTLTTGEDSIRISVQCLTCSPQEIKLLTVSDQSGINNIFRFEREYSEHSHALTFNSSKGQYEYSGYKYLFNVPPVRGNITLACNDTFTHFLLPVENNNLTISLLSVNDLHYNGSNSIYESSFWNNATLEISGDVWNSLRWNVSFFNGSYINGTNTEFMNFFYPASGIHNFSVSVRDDDQITYNALFTAKINDTEYPIITFNTPYANASYPLNSVLNMDIDIIDPNLFAYEITVLDPLNTIYRFNMSGLDTQTYSITDVISDLNASGEWDFYINISDDHTDKKISDYKISTQDKDILIESDLKDSKGFISGSNITIDFQGGTTDAINVNIEKITDRYNFEYILPKKEKHTLNFYVTCDNMFLRHNSNYDGHIVCYDQKKWIDFVSSDAESVEFKKCSYDNCVIVQVKTKVTDKIKFQSIGGINIRSDYFTFRVENVSTTPTNTSLANFTCPSTRETQNIMFFIFVIICCFILFGVIFKFGFLAILGGIALFFFGFTVITCFFWAGLLCNLGGLLLCMWMVKQPMF